MKFLRTQRLQELYARVPEGARVVDVGTDHGLLPIALVESGRCPWAIGADISPGPLTFARRHVAEAGLEERVVLRLGDGLEPVRPGEVDAAVIAGMGGRSIVTILERSPEVAASLTALILQPTQAQDVARAWLLDHGWYIAEEGLLCERRRFYVTMTAHPPGAASEVEAPAPYNEAERLLGRHILASGGSVCAQWVASLRDSAVARVAGMEQSATVPVEHMERARAQAALLYRVHKQLDEANV